jgi:hypothetical protein
MSPPNRPGRAALSEELLVSDPGGRVRVRRRRSHHRRRKRIRRTVIVLAVLALLGVGVRLTPFIRASWRSFSYSYRNQSNPEWAQGDSSQNLALLAAKSVAGPIAIPRRVVYPYSVIPGGVRTPDDLRQLSEHDSVIGRHYAGFDFRNAKVVELDQTRLVYLSYRVGDKVFWTTKKVSLRKGEKLITDGNMTARTRCANRVSESAQKAASPVEPPAEKFEEPFVAGGTAEQIPFPGNFVSSLSPREFPGGGVEGPPGLLSSNSPLGGGFPPLFPPPIPSGSCPPPRKKGEVAMATSKAKPCNPITPVIPEPGTLLLFSSGIAGIYLRHRKAAAK